MKNSYKHQAEFWRKKRRQADISQKDLAELLGYSTAQSVSNWERKIQQIPYPLLLRLCNILDIPKHELKIAILKDKEVDIDSALTQQ